MPEINTMNDFFVGILGDDLVFLKPVPTRIPKGAAMRLAAWIAALADDDDEFDDLLDAVRNT